MDLLHIYSHCYYNADDPALILPYFLRHYTRPEFPSTRIYLYFDDGTVQAAYDIVSQFPQVEIRRCPFSGEMDAQRAAWSSVEIRKSNGKSEWALWADDDELIWHPHFEEHLSMLKQRGVKIVKALDSYTMASLEFPKGNGQIYDEIYRGRVEGIGKPTLIQSDVQLRWNAGRHTASMTSAPVYEDKELTWMHFRHLGDDYCAKRNAKNFDRQSAYDKAVGHGPEIGPTRLKEYTDYMRMCIAESVEVKPEGLTRRLLCSKL